MSNYLKKIIVTYEDDDGYDTRATFLAPNEDEIEDELYNKLYDGGMMYVDIESVELVPFVKTNERFYMSEVEDA